MKLAMVWLGNKRKYAHLKTMLSANLFSKWKDGMWLNEMHNNSFPFQMKMQSFLNEILKTNFIPRKPMQLLTSMHMQKANEYAPMQIFLYFQSKWMKMQKGTIKFIVPASKKQFTSQEIHQDSRTNALKS